jgi:hypothetical protein
VAVGLPGQLLESSAGGEASNAGKDGDGEDSDGEE